MHGSPPLKAMVETLVATPSVSSTIPRFDQSNEDVVHTLANWLEPLGFSIAIHEIDGRPGKSNLIATRGEGTGGLVLSGHTDTVPLDEALWQTNPFELTENDDRWYGLGTCDMKSFFALAIDALGPLGDAAFQRPLTILATADEESSMSGARALSAAELCGARYALIGEPTGLRPVNQHKGIMMLRVVLRGSSGHSSNPALGNNALDSTAEVLSALQQIRTGLAEQYNNPAFEVPVPTMNLGCIHGGDNPNRICDHVELSFDVRVLPGMDNDEVMGLIGERLRPLVASKGLALEFELCHPHVPPFQSTADEFAQTIGNLTGTEPGPVAFATEAPFLTDLGMETIVLGAGSIEQAHQPNEYVAMDQLDPAVDIIRALITRYCLKP